VLRKKFEGNSSAEGGIVGLVDLAHSAATEFFDDAVMRDGLADERILAWHLHLILGSARKQVNEEGKLADQVLGNALTVEVKLPKIQMSGLANRDLRIGQQNYFRTRAAFFPVACSTSWRLILCGLSYCRLECLKIRY